MKRRKIIPSVNNGSLADISFLLLIFFMMVTTFNKDYQIEVTLPPQSESAHTKAISKDRVIEVHINSNDELLLDQLPYELNDLETMVVHLRRISSTDKPGLVSIQMHPESSYEIYLKLIAAIYNGKKLLLDELAETGYNKKFMRLNETQKTNIEDRLKFRISERQIQPL